MDKNFTNALQQDLAQAGRPFPVFEQTPPPQTQASPLPSNRNTNQELEEFQQAFPNVYALAMNDSKCLPQQVWDLVRQGMSITEAFRAWLDTQQTQNQRNTRRSAGSMRSAGRNTAVSDPFLRGFHAND